MEGDLETMLGVFGRRKRDVWRRLPRYSGELEGLKTLEGQMVGGVLIDNGWSVHYQQSHLIRTVEVSTVTGW